MLATLLLAADAVAEKSHTSFYIFAACLVAFAVILSTIGIMRHETFPPSRGVATLIVLVCMGLVAGTMVTAVITA